VALAPHAEAGGARAAVSAEAGTPVVCLLPARNAERDLPGWLNCVRRFADAVVALDDGSTDGTAALLAQDPLVRILLRNPRRETYAGWDDAANRNRLLEAAAPLAPRWVVSLDADERLDAEDAAALRRFLEADALPGCAFGLQHFRMWGAERFDPDYTWIYRVFAYRAGQSFPTRRLHFYPVPTDIPRAAWLRTTIRVRHLGISDDERVTARTVKYRQADADATFRDSELMSRSGDDGFPRWRPRPPVEPVLIAAGDDDPGVAPVSDAAA
jgi:glycosyltransferase involved in cell wall biosynthesis